ncbi:MAG TPA: hypothetical protein VEU62_16675 [Bryobacterales bacterium]|nr:hypothetical protein [Bryobacterales bacterium]
MKIVSPLPKILLAALAAGLVPGQAQTAAAVEKGPDRGQAPAGAAIRSIDQRLDRLERQNAELLDEVRLLRRELEALEQPGSALHLAAAGGSGSATPRGAKSPAESAPSAAIPSANAPLSESERIEALEEKAAVQEGQLKEQDEVKVESSQRVPIRLTGMALFNAFRNSRNAGPAGYPVFASITPGPINSGATLRQSVIGLQFNGPEAILGGKFRGEFMMDLYGGSNEVLGSQVRLRTAFIEGQWETRGFLVGQEKPIFAPREPNSLAQVGVSPLTGAGNLWRWRPQVRFEQRLGLGSSDDVQARIGVSETYEDGARVDPQFFATLEQSRPALEGRFQLAHHFDDARRLEIAPGFHLSTTHVAGASVPSRAFSLDWFFNPIRRVELSGSAFIGRNLANLGGGGAGQGFTILPAGAGQYHVIPVRTRGGWAQVTFIATPRLSFNLYGGQDDPNNRDLPANGIAKNLAYAANAFYRLAPNVVVGVEASKVRTQFMGGQHPMNNHYDLAVAYLF